MYERILSTAATYSPWSIDDVQSVRAGPRQGQWGRRPGGRTRRTSSNRAQVISRSYVTTTAQNPAESRADWSEVTSARPVASRPPTHASGGTSLSVITTRSGERATCRFGGGDEFGEACGCGVDLVADRAVGHHRLDRFAQPPVDRRHSRRRSGDRHAKVDSLCCGDDLDREDAADVGQHVVQLAHRGPAHRDVVLLIPAGRNGVDARGMGENLVFADQ